MKPERIFCDANAGCPVEPDVLECFVATERAVPGNPASSHASGRRARAVLEAARERIANALRISADDVLFTSGGTESANLAVRGLGNTTLPVLVSDVEHPAVLEAAAVRGRQAWQVSRSATAIVTRPSSAVGLLCLAHAQSEVGALQPIAAAADLARDLGVPLFVDAAQTLGRVPLAPLFASGAFVALSPHKSGGLRGHGILAGDGLQQRLVPLLRGGGQEFGLRPGTQSAALATANALAIERALTEQAQRADNMARARDAFLAALAAAAVPHRVLTPLAAALPNTAMVEFGVLEGRNLLPALDLAGIEASHGSACSSGAPTPPRILRWLDLDDARARTCVRFSFAHDVTTSVAEEVARRVGDVVARSKKI